MPNRFHVAPPTGSETLHLSSRPQTGRAGCGCLPKSAPSLADARARAGTVIALQRSVGLSVTE
jgi:hypothetical protein